MYDGVMARDACIRSNPDLAHTVCLIVAHRGEIVFEGFYRDSGPDVLHTVHSVTKSFTSTLVGTLAGAGLVDLDARVASLVPAPAFDTDPEKRPSPSGTY